MCSLVILKTIRKLKYLVDPFRRNVCVYTIPRYVRDVGVPVSLRIRRGEEWN